MIVEFRNQIPQQLYSTMTQMLVDAIVEIDGNRYRIDGYNSATREFRARRARTDNQVIPQTVTECVYVPDIRHLVVCP